jgi:surface protein
MFNIASAFNQPLANWNTSKVTNMGNMFNTASVFDQNISNWNVSLIPTKPSQFDTNTPATWLTAEKPVWGTTGA